MDPNSTAQIFLSLKNGRFHCLRCVVMQRKGKVFAGWTWQEKGVTKVRDSILSFFPCPKCAFFTCKRGPGWEGCERLTSLNALGGTTLATYIKPVSFPVRLCLWAARKRNSFILLHPGQNLSPLSALPYGHLTSSIRHFFTKGKLTFSSPSSSIPGQVRNRQTENFKNARCDS